MRDSRFAKDETSNAAFPLGRVRGGHDIEINSIVGIVADFVEREPGARPPKVFRFGVPLGFAGRTDIQPRTRVARDQGHPLYSPLAVDFGLTGLYEVRAEEQRYRTRRWRLEEVTPRATCGGQQQTDGNVSHEA